MSDGEAQGGGGGARGGTSARRLVAAFRQLPTAEQTLAGAAAGVIVAFIVRWSWGELFHAWFPTCALLGAVAVLALLLLRLLRVRFLGPTARVYALLGCAVVPALGFVLDEFRDFWRGVMFAGVVLMGFAAAKIADREEII
jgi:hypothetical protein